MQIQKWKIDNYHGILNMNLTFPINESSGAVILLGENGSGKSTTLEMLLRFFAAFDSPTFVSEFKSDFEIVYRIGTYDVRIQQKDLLWTLSHREIGESESVIDFNGSFESLRRWSQKNSLNLFPQRIIAFYSGYADHLAPIYKWVNRNYKIACKNTLYQYFEMAYSSRTQDIELPNFPHKKYIYCDDALMNLYLISILAGKESYEKSKIKEFCSIDNIMAIEIILTPKEIKDFLNKYLFDSNQNQSLKNNFWRVLEFIDSELCALMRASEISFNENSSRFIVTDIDSIPDDTIRVFNFLEKLVTIFDAKISVRITGQYGEKNTKALSEGQRQLIKVIGMLGATKESDCFVLMDEPDSHMNPRWKYEIKEIVDKVLDGATNTQAIIATHDPLVVNGQEKEYVRIFVRDPARTADAGSQSIKVLIPTEDTEGMGIDGLLQSEYYGLRSTLDTKTRSKLEEKRDLLVKRKEGTITQEEREKLYALTDEIEGLAFTRNIPTDDLYDEFVVAMHKFQQENPISELTSEQIRERNRKAHEIIKELMEK